VTASEIIKALGTSWNSPFSLRANQICVPNVSWGMFEWGEADFISVTKSGYITEVEVKVSITDLKKDKDKQKWLNPRYNKMWKSIIKKFYYAIPEELLEEAEKIISKEHGIIKVWLSKSFDYRVQVIRYPEYNKARKLKDSEILNLTRLCAFRYWNGK